MRDEPPPELSPLPAADPAGPSRATRVVRWDGDARTAEPAADEVAVEEPLEIRVRGRPVSVTMRTPGHDAELAVGFLLSEGIVRGPGDVIGAEHCGRNADGHVINVRLAPEVFVDFGRLTRHVFASSSCGLCGKATIDAVRLVLRPELAPAGGPAAVGVGADVLTAIPTAMRAAQATFDRTGGLHAAALFDTGGRLLVLREDVGRHNAVDKVLGHALRDGPFPPDRHVLLVSGRTSFEIMQKALAAGVPVVAGVSAPSSLAVAFARDSGQTLIGFLRGRRMNVYAHPERIRFG